jgi:hypothetical protein
MRVDTNTRGNFKWFYFTVKMPANEKIKLNICNFTKVTQLINLYLGKVFISINKGKKQV